MKLDSNWSRSPAKQVPRPPLISFKEICTRYGLRQHQLMAHFSNSSFPVPVPAFKHHNTMAASNSWYHLKDVLVWRKAFDAQNKRVEEQALTA